MNRFIAGVLTLIALGVLLVAYGLLSPRASAYDAGMMDPYSVAYVPNGAGGYMAYIVPVGAVPPSSQMVALPGYPNSMAVNPYAVQTVQTAPAAPAARPVTVRRAPSRNWGKTAMVIGGSSAAGAGLGGLIGGKKGALIGAAIGGGASTLYESTK